MKRRYVKVREKTAEKSLSFKIKQMADITFYADI
jgi:hypothetical protein